eukprot:3408020-Rhodomonas_salina.2
MGLAWKAWYVTARSEPAQAHGWLRQARIFCFQTAETVRKRKGKREGKAQWGLGDKGKASNYFERKKKKNVQKIETAVLRRWLMATLLRRWLMGICEGFRVTKSYPSKMRSYAGRRDLNTTRS